MTIDPEQFQSRQTHKVIVNDEEKKKKNLDFVMLELSVQRRE